jgi:hypothetical protein
MKSLSDSPQMLQKWRERIQVSALLTALHGYALDPKSKPERERIKAIEILLRKVMPDLKAMDMSGSVTTDIQVTKITEELIEPPR